MRQLGGLDNLMIEGEMPGIPLHMSAVMIYDTGGKRGANRLFERFRQSFDTLAEDLFPVLRCKVESVSMELDKAYWVEDPNFNLDYHLSRSALPGKRDWRALYAACAHFHAQPLDRSMPLWRALVVEGLDALDGVPPGATALFLKIHHAVMDGKSALRLVSAMHATGPESDAPLIADSMPTPEAQDKDFSAPTWWQKYGRAWQHSITHPVELAMAVAKSMPELLAPHDTVSQDRNKSDASPVPQLRFNHPLSPNRVVGHVRLPLRTLRRLQKKHSVSINDIALCVVAGGMKHYLKTLGELPEADIQGMMPVDIRRAREDGTIGNHVTMAKVPLFTGLRGTKDRLLAINAITRERKASSRKKTGVAPLAIELVEDIHPGLILWLGNWLVRSGKIDKLPQSTNTVVTNVPGIRGRAWLGGAELVDYLGFGPLAPNLGLFHTVSSTTNYINISFLSTPEFLDDGEDYRQALEKSWQQVRRL